MQIIERLRSDRFRNRQLRSMLLDQSFVAGIGNYLRCETLYYCGLDPRSRSRDLSDEDVEHLADIILELAWQSYQTGGITNDLEVANSLMEQGARFGDVRHYVYNRKGKPCYYCNTKIRKTQGSGQAIYYCPVCQSANREGDIATSEFHDGSEKRSVRRGCERRGQTSTPPISFGSRPHSVVRHRRARAGHCRTATRLLGPELR